MATRSSDSRALNTCTNCRSSERSPVTNKFIAVEENASLLRKKERTIREWCCNQSIPHYKVGNSLLFIEKEILKWLRRNCRVEVSVTIKEIEKSFKRLKENSTPPQLSVKEKVYE